MATGRTHMCSTCFSVALCLLVFYFRLNIRKLEKDIAYARKPVKGCEYATWKFLNPSISKPSVKSENYHFVLTRHRNFKSSQAFTTGLLLLCGDINSQRRPKTRKRTQNGNSSVPLKSLMINATSMKSVHKVGSSSANSVNRI